MLALVAAVAENGIIGSANRLPWHLPADLQHFKALTLDKPVLMGRKTFESIGRPLPHRRNLVLTSRKDFTAAGAEVVSSLEQAMALTADAPELMIIGGTQVYRLALPKAVRIHLTRVHATVPGDARFPHCDWTQWREVARTHHPADEKNMHAMSFITLEREGPIEPGHARSSNFTAAE